MKDKLAVAISIVLLVLSAASVGYIIYNSVAPKSSDVIHVEITDEENVHNIKFEDLFMAPGQMSEYQLKLRNRSKNDFHLQFSFKELEDGNLKKFVRVRVTAKDEIILDKPLAELFEEEKTVLPFSVENADNFTMTVSYYMPEDVTNEAQNADASFELIIEAID